MAKSKKQKQAEAIRRLRAQFHDNCDTYLKRQPGTKIYDDWVARFGTDYANKRATEARDSFHRYCKEAHVDTHGNELRTFDE
jgi:hypothetical protein